MAIAADGARTALGGLVALEGARRTPLEVTTLWDFPFQSGTPDRFGASSFHGVSPSGVAWNLIARYTKPGDFVIDAMAGSSTTLDVANVLGRRGLGFDLAPQRADVVRADARSLPLPDACADLCFVDPPYSDNVRYSDDPRCIGRISCRDERFYAALEGVAAEVARVLRPGGIAAWLISDGYKDRCFTPVGFRLFAILSKHLSPVDIVCVTRRNDRSLSPMWEHRARLHGFFLRGFKYLFISRKAGSAGPPAVVP